MIICIVEAVIIILFELIIICIEIIIWIYVIFIFFLFKLLTKFILILILLLFFLIFIRRVLFSRISLVCVFLFLILKVMIIVLILRIVIIFLFIEHFIVGLNMRVFKVRRYLLEFYFLFNLSLFSLHGEHLLWCRIIWIGCQTKVIYGTIKFIQDINYFLVIFSCSCELLLLILEIWIDERIHSYWIESTTLYFLFIYIVMDILPRKYFLRAHFIPLLMKWIFRSKISAIILIIFSFSIIIEFLFISFFLLLISVNHLNSNLRTTV